MVDSLTTYDELNEDIQFTEDETKALLKLSEKEILNVIKDVYEKKGVILDPHSAIGFGVIKKVNLNGNNVVLATAHPCKFPDAIDRSINIKPNLPKKLMHVMTEKENYDIISNNLKTIKKYVKDRI